MNQALPTILLRFEGLPPSPNQTTRTHWSNQARIKKEWGEYAAQAAMVARVQNRVRSPYQRAHLHYHISVGDNRRHDPDNLLFSITKPVNDGLVGQLLVDDSIDNIELSFSFDRGPKGFTVELTPL